MRRFLKRAAERVLASAPVISLSSRLRPVRGAVLAYHNVVPSGELASGDSSLHLALDSFLEQIEWLGRSYRIVGLTELFDRADEGEPVVAITFDDAYNGAVRLALPELVRLSLPATVFVCSSLQGGESMWWDAFADASGLDPSVRSVALGECRGEDSRVKAWAEKRRIQSAQAIMDQRIASPAAIAAATRSSAITIGAHTHTHPNLTTLPEAALRFELTESKRLLQARYAAFIPWMAYPYGLADSRVRRATMEAGFVAGLRVKGGGLRDAPSADRFDLPRVYVPRGISLDNLRLRLSGVI